MITPLIFVWTLEDVIGLGFWGLVFVVIIIASVYEHFAMKFKKKHKP